jgi:hypothetical protein
MNLVLDAGALIGIDRDDQRTAGLIELGRRSAAALVTTAPVVAQAWRGSAKQARLARLLAMLDVRASISPTRTQRVNCWLRPVPRTSSTRCWRCWRVISCSPVTLTISEFSSRHVEYPRRWSRSDRLMRGRAARKCASIALAKWMQMAR